MTTPALQLWPLMRRVERTAWNAIVKCVRAKRLESLPLPIPVDQWIEGPLDIRLAITDLAHLGPGVLGAARPASREIDVSQSIADQEVRFRFTAAHELGHILLHAKLGADFRDSDDHEWFERRIEREADRFAAAFLMPIPALCAVFAEAASKAAVDPHALLAGAEAGDSKTREIFKGVVLPHLTRRFRVSMSATVRRFSDVQLPTGEAALSFEAGLKLLSPSDMQEVLRFR